MRSQGRILRNTGFKFTICEVPLCNSGFRGSIDASVACHQRWYTENNLKRTGERCHIQLKEYYENNKQEKIDETSISIKKKPILTTKRKTEVEKVTSGDRKSDYKPPAQKIKKNTIPSIEYSDLDMYYCVKIRHT